MGSCGQKGSKQAGIARGKLPLPGGHSKTTSYTELEGSAGNIKMTDCLIL